MIQTPAQSPASGHEMNHRRMSHKIAKIGFLAMVFLYTSKVTDYEVLCSIIVAEKEGVSVPLLAMKVA